MPDTASLSSEPVGSSLFDAHQHNPPLHDLLTEYAAPDADT
jgi:hypothetical protein